MRITLKDVAVACDIDISTVSRALRDDQKVKKETRNRIKVTAAKLGYSPNLAARNLVAGKTHTVWFILPSLSNTIDQLPAEYSSIYLAQKGYDVLTAVYRDNQDVFIRLTERLKQGVTDGAFIINSYFPDYSILNTLIKQNYPLLLIDRSIPGMDIPTITTNNYSGASNLAEMCMNEGCEEFLIYCTKDNNSAERDRYIGAVETLNKAGIEYHVIESTKQTDFPKLKGRKLAILSSTQWRIDKLLKDFSNELQKLKMVFATFDRWSGQPFPAEKVFLCIQDHEKIAETASEIMLNMIEEGKWPKEKYFYIPPHDYKVIECNY